MTSNEELLDSLKSSKVLRTRNIIKAFAEVDRKDFVPLDLKGYAYLDQPLPIGHGQTISQPYTVAFMLELLQPEAGDNVLDVGFGSGWTTALLASIVGPSGRVYGFEINKEVFAFGAENLYKRFSRRLSQTQRGLTQKDPFKIHNIELFNKSGWNGLIEHAPYDGILVSAAGKEIPEALKEQLQVGGRLVIPVDQSVVMLERLSEDKFKEEVYPGFVFCTAC